MIKFIFCTSSCLLEVLFICSCKQFTNFMVLQYFVIKESVKIAIYLKEINVFLLQKNYDAKLKRERTLKELDRGMMEEKYREMQSTIHRNEGVITMLQNQLEQLQKQHEEVGFSI